MERYLIIIHAAEEGGFWAEFPSLPGCYTQGESIDEVLEDAPKAVESHLEGLAEFGNPIPPQQVVIATIEVSAPPAA